MKIFRSKTLILILSSFALALSACMPADVPPTTTPTSTQISVDAIYTQAAATIYAGQTGTASAQPSNTPTPTNTLTRTPTITTSPTLTKVVYVPIQPVYTIIVTTTGTPGTRVPLPTATYGAVGCNNSAFIQDMSIPNNTKVTAGSSFTKTWRIKNTGTCSWNFNFKFTFTGGQLFNSDTTKIRRIVGPGTSTDISLAMVAPNSPGTYTSYWRMADDSGKLFGTGFSVVIVVPGATYTPVPPTAYP